MAGIQLHVQYYSGDIQTIFEIRQTSIIEFIYFSPAGDTPNCYLYSLHGEKILPAAAFIYYIQRRLFSIYSQHLEETLTLIIALLGYSFSCCLCSVYEEGTLPGVLFIHCMGRTLSSWCLYNFITAWGGDHFRC